MTLRNMLNKRNTLLSLVICDVFFFFSSFSLDIFVPNKFLVQRSFIISDHYSKLWILYPRPVHLPLCVLPSAKVSFICENIPGIPAVRRKSREIRALGPLCFNQPIIKSMAFTLCRPDNQLCQLNTLLASCGHSIIGLLHLSRAGWSRKMMPLITAKRKKFGQNDSLHHRFCLLVGN